MLRLAVARQFIRHIVQAGLADPIVMAGSSDGGAHLASFTGADYSTRLLAEWVPAGILSLEQAVWRLAGMPATVHGLQARGFLRAGAFADVVVYDPATLAAGEAHLVRDFPADTERYVVDATGYRAVVVNDEVLVEDGAHTGALPGHVVARALEHTWGENGPRRAQSAPMEGVGAWGLYDRIQALRPQDDAQRALQAQALGIVIDLARTRWLMFEQETSSSISMPFLVVLVFWLTIVFMSFGLFAPPNATVVGTLLLSALSVAARSS